jgi:two-component system phosphate regulon response regulator PhoB
MPKTILVIEDDNAISEIIKTILSLNQFEVIGLENGDNILNVVGDHNPDLILTDYMLPGITGGRICQLIKENDRTSHIPVILMSAYHKKAMSVLNFKYDAFLPKPFDIDKLISLVQKLIN